MKYKTASALFAPSPDGKNERPCNVRGATASLFKEDDMFTKDFWKDTGERTIYTMAECLLASVAGTAMITSLDWKVVGITTVTAGVVTILKCIVTYKEK